MAQVLTVVQTVSFLLPRLDYWNNAIHFPQTGTLQSHGTQRNENKLEKFTATRTKRGPQPADKGGRSPERNYHSKTQIPRESSYMT